MYFKQILNDTHGCASYVIACGSGAAAIVDPALEIEPYALLISERGMTLKYVIDTHVHADHVSGARQLAEQYGAELCLFETAPAVYPFKPLSDNQEIELGDLRLRVLHTPGHRQEMMSLLVINPERSPEPSMVLTGDSLLVGDVGRPDFMGGDVAAQYDSLNRLLRLPDWVAVFPAHFEGPCGKGMCGRPSSTIGFERLYNPLARLSRSEFIDYLRSGVPARPLNMRAIEATNRGVDNKPWAMLTTTPTICDVDLADPSTAEMLHTGKAVLLDIREPDEYAARHLPGSVNIPQSDLADSLDRLPKETRIFVICKAGHRSLQAARFLVQSGRKHVCHVRGGMDRYIQVGHTSRSQNEDGAWSIKVTEPKFTRAYDYVI